MKSFLICFFIVSILNCQSLEFSIDNFKKADSIARTHHGKSLKNLPILVHRLTSNLDDDTEKFRAIFKWVCTNIKNDYTSYRRTVQKRAKYRGQPLRFQQWNRTYLPEVYKRLIEQRKTSCTGYAYLIQQMARLAGLECEIINGFGRTSSAQINEASLPNHSWNAVKLDNNWFLSDATWSAGRIVFEKDMPVFKFDFSEAYFLTSPILFSRTHYPINKEWLLLQKDYSFKDFLEGPLVYKSSFDEGVRPLSPSKMFLTVEKEETIDFEFSRNKDIGMEFVELLIIKNGNRTTLHSTPCCKNTSCKITYQFKRKGVYDVHLLVNGKICFTYVVEVTTDSSYP